jgi:hypothetical protein
LALARALQSLGKHVAILTDDVNYAPIAAALAASNAAYPSGTPGIELRAFPPGDVDADRFARNEIA